MKLSVVVPAHDEEGSVAATVTGIAAALSTAGIDYEVLVVDDGSSDDAPPARSTRSRASTRGSAALRRTIPAASGTRCARASISSPAMRSRS